MVGLRRRARLALILVLATAALLHADPPANLVGVCPEVFHTFIGGNDDLQRVVDRDARKFVDSRREEMLRRSASLNRAIAADTRAGKPMRVNVLAIGAGPHSGVFLANYQDSNPGAKVLVVDASDGRFGTFDGVRGFRVNTREYPGKSGNTFPGVPIQPRDLNTASHEFVGAQNFGDVTVLAHAHVGGNVAFGNKVVRVTENPKNPNDPSGYKDGARYRVEMENGNVVVTDKIFAATGLGDPKAEVKHAPSQEIIRREMESNAERIAGNPRFGPRVSVVDGFLRLQEEDVAAGRDPMARYEGGTIAVVGAGDGGNIAVEGALRLTRSLNPKGLPAANDVVWIGQKAKDGDEFWGNMKPGKRARYGDIRHGYDDGKLKSAPGRLTTIREIEQGGKKRFELVYQQFDEGGKPVAGTENKVVADHVVFAVGYDNRVLDPFKSLKVSDGAGDVDLSVVTADTTDFTGNPKLAAESPVAGQVTVDGQPHDIFVAGNAASDRGNDKRFKPTDANWKDAVGGYLDILLMRTAALGRHLGAADARRGGVPPKPQLEAGAARTSSVVPLKASSLRLYDNVTATSLALREATAKVLSRFRYPPNQNIRIELRRTSQPGEFDMVVEGLNFSGANQLRNALAGPDAEAMRFLLYDYFQYGGHGLSVHVAARSDGTPTLEGMKTELIPEPR